MRNDTPKSTLRQMSHRELFAGLAVRISTFRDARRDIPADREAQAVDEVIAEIARRLVEAAPPAGRVCISTPAAVRAKHAIAVYLTVANTDDGSDYRDALAEFDAALNGPTEAGLVE
jgi:hypothetical protein